MRGSRSRGCHERPAFRVIRPPELVGRAEKREPALQHEIGRAQRLNSSHDQISYAVFCLKKKKRLTKLRIKSEENTCKKKSRQKFVCSILVLISLHTRVNAIHSIEHTNRGVILMRHSITI